MNLKHAKHVQTKLNLISKIENNILEDILCGSARSNSTVVVVIIIFVVRQRNSVFDFFLCLFVNLEQRLSVLVLFGTFLKE